MLHFNYTLDNELKAPIGQLPSGIQTQAFEMALNQISRKFHETMQLIAQPVPGVGASAAQGMAPEWQMRIKAQSDFITALFPRLLQVGQSVALGDVGDALVQSTLSKHWNRWSPMALKTYSRTLSAFQKEVNKAMSNNPSVGTPAVFIKMAAIARMPPPAMATVNSLGAYTPDDAAYLAAFNYKKATPLALGALAGASLVGLLAWWVAGPASVAILGEHDYR